MTALCSACGVPFSSTGWTCEDRPGTRPLADLLDAWILEGDLAWLIDPPTDCPACGVSARGTCHVACSLSVCAVHNRLRARCGCDRAWLRAHGHRLPWTARVLARLGLQWVDRRRFWPGAEAER